MKKLIKKNVFIELLKNKYPVPNVIENYEALPETIVNDRNEYIINNVVNEINGEVESVELNYYCKTAYKFLFPYVVDTSIINAVNNLNAEYIKFNKQ